MENETILYFDSTSARPSEVRVLLFNATINLYSAGEENFIVSYPLKESVINQVGENHFVYLNNDGTIYLQINSTHPILNMLVKEVNDANDNWLKKIMKQRIVVLVALMLSLVIGCYFLIVNLVPFIGTRMIDRDMEIQMGNNLKNLMIDEARLIGSEVDTARTEKLQAFADRIKLSSEYPIRLTVIKGDIVNAYALPGGQVVVYSGMLDKIQGPESLVALLAHESTHVNERHTLRSLLRSTANGILISLIFNDATGVSAALVSNAETLTGLHYSRSLEEEADRKGMDLMLSNGVDAYGMQQLMNLLKEDGDVPEDLSFLSSHPLTAERIKAAIAYISQHPQHNQKRDDLERIFSEIKKP